MAYAVLIKLAFGVVGRKTRVAKKHGYVDIRLILIVGHCRRWNILSGGRLHLCPTLSLTKCD